MRLVLFSTPRLSLRPDPRVAPPAARWLVFCAEGFAGWVLLAPLGPHTEIGWRLVRAARGRGYAVEGARPVLEHALAFGRPVVADMDPANAASAAVARRLGMERAGQAAYEGRLLDRYVAGTLRTA